MVYSGQRENSPADQTLREALRAQLHWLHAVFPLPCWMVVCRHETGVRVLASHAAPGAACLPLEDASLHGAQWRAWPHACGFEYLPPSGEGAVAHAGGPGGQLLLRHGLHTLTRGGQVALLGQVSVQGLERIRSGGYPAPELTQALNALIHCLRLFDELEVLTQRLGELQHNAFTEPLTGVLNRAGWMNRLQHLEAQLARSGDDVAIIMLDLDQLKLVNDTHGHSAGDELLQLTAHTIRSTLRLGDIVGRLGGDEFGVAVQCTAAVMVSVLADRLRGALDEVGVEVSMGLALRSEVGNLDQAVALADERMYDHKRSKPKSICAMKWRRGSLSTMAAGLYTENAASSASSGESAEDTANPCT